jgi:hypothetical protein
MSEMIDVTYYIPAPPKGWEYAGVREVQKGELYFDGKGWVLWDCDLHVDAATPVAIKKIQWRPATQADVGREDAKAWDTSMFAWRPGKLIHVFTDIQYPFVVVVDSDAGQVVRYAQCEVPILPNEKESNATQDPQRRRVSRDDEPKKVAVRKRRQASPRKGSPKKS